MLKEGFLGTAAPFYADLVLVLEVGMGLALLLGAYLARTRRHRAHAVCQSSVVILNLIVIIFVMMPSFSERVLPKIPERLGRSYYSLVTVHALLGSFAEIGGLYILISAGTSILPQRFRLSRYKLWMRTVLVLWWAVVFLGFATYVRWYVRL